MAEPTRDHLRITGTKGDVAYLRTTPAVRVRSRLLMDRAERGDSRAFVVNVDRLPAVADYVAGVLRESQSGRPLPTHGRMRHFNAGGVARTRAFEARLRGADRVERARAKIDLVLPSVLLDAGAGAAWAYDDEGARLPRSEGLAVATFRWFMSGALSSSGRELRCDAVALERMTTSEVSRAFQVRADNPLVGLETRAEMLRSLGRALRGHPEYFGAPARPGNLVDWALASAEGGRLPATELLGVLLVGLARIWPGRVEVAGENMGDCWPHPALGEGVRSLVPFHKLSQWLTYSLVEPATDAGLTVVGIDALTRLPEYRNGGLLLDLGVLELRDEADARRRHAISDPLVVEWRALTVVLLDRLAPMIRERLGDEGSELDAAGLVEGSTWLAGRTIARERRPGGVPPLSLDSDGTVF
jgi:hypothetical protein